VIDHGEHRIKPVSAFLPASPVGEQIAEEKRRAKCPAAAAIVKLLKSGMGNGHTGNDPKR
jgi:hypothetical protein